jgi:hypothetical protein
MLWYSNVITHDSSSLDVAGATSDPQTYYEKVSVRECMLFLIREIRGNHRATNSMNARRWVDAMRMAEMAFQNEEMHIDESSSNSSEHSDHLIKVIQKR